MTGKATRIQWWALAGLCAMVVGLGGCHGAGGEEGEGGWTFGDDTGTVSDTSDTRGPLECEQYRDSTSCMAGGACEWWPNPCPGASGGTCLPEGAQPGAPRCSKPVDCRAFASRAECNGRSNCSWASRTCPDGTEVGACSGGPTAPPMPPCPEPEDPCADQAPERCDPGECSVYSPGCGSNPDAFEGPTCLPEQTCSDEADCDAGETCRMLSVAVDCRRCDACGAGRRTCVPDSWVESAEPDGCRGLDEDACRQTDRCDLIWPNCNDEAPDGVQTFDTPTCLPTARCGAAKSCPPNRVCTEVWSGCGPDEFCRQCASTEKRCLRVGR